MNIVSGLTIFKQNSLTDSFTGCDWSGNSGESTWGCCSSSNPCWIFEGDCDGDDDCFGYFLCGSNNCFDSFSSTADCCYDPLEGNITSMMSTQMKALLTLIGMRQGGFTSLIILGLDFIS